MARRSRLRNLSTPTRGVLPTANRPRLRRVSVRPTVYSDLRFIEDRRTFHPDRAWRPVRSINRHRHKLVIGASNVGSRQLQRPDMYSQTGWPSPFVAFAVPDKVAICVRRNRRREVMHALGKAGRSGQRKPRRNVWSDIHC